jgi:quinohemoprotein ethanol dehydrogenase
VTRAAGPAGRDGRDLTQLGNISPGTGVFQGRGSGELWVYAADTGKILKSIQTGSHIMAGPITYAVNGVQYVAVQAGYGGTNIAGYTVPPSSAASKYQNVNRIIAFRLDGGDVPTPAALTDMPFPKPPDTHGTCPFRKLDPSVLVV